jgi:hypothetical protein
MSSSYRIAILSDIHYAAAGEQARGDDYETRDIANPMARRLLRFYRDYIWLRYPLRQNHLLDRFLNEVGEVDCAVANGDYTCDSAFQGVADDAASESVRACLGRLRARFGDRFQATLGDHELGKKNLRGDRGTMQLASYERAVGELGLRPLWQTDLGRWRLLGVTSSLLAFPDFLADARPEELPRWQALREAHLADIRAVFAALPADRRVLLFCHDPTALPYLAREPVVAARLGQIAQTIIGHLHTPLVLWKSRLLAGMPQIHFLGHSARRMTGALHEASHWRPFRVRLCPAMAGTELLKDGGYLTAVLSDEARFEFHPIPR